MVDDGDRIVALEHAQVVVPKQVVERSPALPDYRRRHFLQHDELRMAVGEARAREPAFVDQGMDVGEPFGSRRVDAVLPGFRDRCDLALAEIGEGADVVGRVDDDFLALERRVEVRYDPNPPGVADPERLGRGAVLAACAEGTVLELLGRCLLRRRQPGTRPPGAARCEDDSPTRQRVFADLRQLGGLLRPASRNGLKSSIGSGRMIVEERSELISSIV
jgi:hypothetical protein